MKILISLMALFSALSFASIQDKINSLPPEGGVVELPCGEFRENRISLRTNVTLRGSGACTVIPSVDIQNGSSQRSYNIYLERLVIDPSLDGSDYIGVDFRNASTSRLIDIGIRNANIGVYFAGNAYYNVIQDVMVNAKHACFQFDGIANENIVRGGRCQSHDGFRQAYGVEIINANSIKIDGTAFETLSTAIVLRDGALGTFIQGIRAENVGCVFSLSHNSARTTVVSSYKDNIDGEFCGTGEYKYLGY